jgi:hypothetical protein
LCIFLSFHTHHPILSNGNSLSGLISPIFKSRRGKKEGEWGRGGKKGKGEKRKDLSNFCLSLIEKTSKHLDWRIHVLSPTLTCPALVPILKEERDKRKRKENKRKGEMVMEKGKRKKENRK